MTPEEKRTDIDWLLSRMAEDQHTYGGGLGGTCWECPFASRPLDRWGNEAPYEEWGNDPTEAWFGCSLPTRQHKLDSKRPEWGEHAPCTQEEWVGHIRTLSASNYEPRHKR